MPRVGTCKDCGTRFKIPDAVKATAAKCAKCGGTVEIPPADAAPAPPAPATPPAPPARTAPPRPTPAPARPAAVTPPKPVAPPARPAAPAAPKAAPAPPRPAAAVSASRTPAKGPAAAAAAREAAAIGREKAGVAERASGRGAGRARAGARTPRESAKPKSKALLYVILGIVVIGGAAGAWFAFSGGGEPAPAETTPTAPETAPETAPGTPAGEAAPPAAEEGVPVEAPAPTEAPADATTDPAAAAPPAAAAAPAPAATDMETPRDPVVAIEPLGAVPGTTDEQLVEWTALVKALYLEDPGAKQSKKLRAELEAIDIVDSTPAFLNSLIGLDMSDPIHIRNAGNLVQDWDERQGHQIKFFFDLDASRTGTVDINKRLTVIEGWRRAFENKMKDAKLLEEYRANAAASLAQRQAKDG